MKSASAASDSTGVEGSGPRYLRHSKAQFLAALVLVLISIPIVERHPISRFMEPLQLTVVLLGGLWVVSEQRRMFVIGLVSATPALLGSWLDHWRPEIVPNWVFVVPAVLFCLFVVAGVLRFILRARHVDSEVLCAGVAGYLLLGLLWTFSYVLVATLIPGAFAFAAGSEQMSGFTALYFSFVTLTTVGFGDIVPVAPVVRMLAISESTIGVFYTTMLIARLVTLYAGDADHEAKDDVRPKTDR